ncbi:MAG: hypothetical protein RL318_2447, partial [Fibrobacterota bacterium]
MNTFASSLKTGLSVLCLLLATACRKPNAAQTAEPANLPGSDTSLVSCEQKPVVPESTAPSNAKEGEDLFPLRSITVKTDVNGPVARVTLHQVFGNRNTVPVEAVYVFPLPHQAAVHGMSIHTGNRVVRAVIKRRAEARETYEEASRQGKTASLLEQERPDVFTQSVANLMPGDTIGVDIELSMPLAHVDGWTEFVFPTVVGPRFCPPGKVPDMGRIGAPRLPPGMAAPQSLDIQVKLDAGFPLTALESPTHCVRMNGKMDPNQTWQGPVAVSLDGGQAVPDRDYVLRWKTRKPATSATLLTDGNGKEGHFLLEIQPPARATATNTTPKELVFLVDQSGSMGGEPIALVKRAMRKALESMEPRDKFQIIGFSSSTVKFETAPVAATKNNIQRGLSWVDGLQANGGTMMLDGIQEAMRTPVAPGSLRILAMMTDGYIGNESEILGWIAKNLDARTRTFGFGVGSSVNRSFLWEFGNTGGGKTEFVTLDEDPGVAVARFHKRIDRPVLTDIHLDWHDLAVTSTTPSRIPDLFEGEPLTLSGKFKASPAGIVTVHGRVAGEPVTIEIPVDFAKSQERPAIGALWARAQLQEMSRAGAYEPGQDTVEIMTKLALDYKLMSAYTSFVAVAESVVNQGGKQKTVAVPVPMPRGVSPQALGGGIDKIMTHSVVWAPAEGGATAVDAILAGGGGKMAKSAAGRGASGNGDRMGSMGGIGFGLGSAGRTVHGTTISFPGRATARGSIAPPKPMDVELGGEQGARSPESILRVIRMHLGGLRYTYEKFLRTDSTLKGKISFKFTIDRNGDILAISLASSSTGSQALDEELMKKARRMKFDNIEGGNVTVTYAFVLE